MDNNFTQIPNDEAIDQAVAPNEDMNEPVTSDAEPDISAPLEEISPRITFNDVLDQYKYIYKNTTRLILYALILSVFWTVSNCIRYGGFAEGGSGIIISFILFFLFFIVKKSIKINAKAQFDKKGDVTYRVFYNRIEYEYRVGGDLYTFYRIDPKKITKAKLLQNTLVFVHEGVCFMIPCRDLGRDSLIYKAVLSEKDKKACKTRSRTKRQTAIIWLLASAVTVLTATIIVSIFAPLAAIPFAFLSFFSISLPIISLAFIGGWRARGKGLIIATCIILILALFVSFVAATGVYDEAYVDEDEAAANNILDRTAEFTHVDFPDVYNVYLNENQFYDSQTKSYVTYTYMDCSLTEENSEYLKSQVVKSDLWITEMTEEMEYFIGNSYSPYNDPFMIVNLTEGTYNQLPSTKNTCEYVIIAFNYSANSIFIYTFSKAYSDVITSTPGTIMA